jgi:hypothetical protein
METIVERPPALDVHKVQVTACARVRRPDGARVEEGAEFQATVPGLLALRDRLAELGVAQVAMEATGVFWKPVWHVLEDDVECLTQIQERQREVNRLHKALEDAGIKLDCVAADILGKVRPRHARRARRRHAHQAGRGSLSELFLSGSATVWIATREAGVCSENLNSCGKSSRPPGSGQKPRIIAGKSPHPGRFPRRRRLG